MTITLNQAIARLRTWMSDPSEDARDRLIAAALATADGADGASALLSEAAAKYRSEQREMAYQVASFGCEIDAETARQDLRESPEIVDLDDGGHGFDTMVRARGCRIVAKVPRLGGRWVGFGSE